MNALRETRAVAPVIISLDAVRTGARGTIEMNRDEGRAGMGVGDRHPGRQRNENVGVARHNHTVSAGLKQPPQTKPDIEALVFLTDPLARDATAVVSAVAGVDDDRARLGEGGSSQRAKTCDCEKDKTVTVHHKK